MPNFKEFWLPTTTSASVNLNPSSVCLVSVVFLIFLFSASLCPNRKSETLLSLPIPVLELCSGIERKLSHPRRQCGFSPLLSSPSFFLHPVRTQRFGRSVYKTLPPLHSQRLTPVGSPAVQGEAGFVAPVGLQFEGFQSRRTLFLSTILVYQGDNSPFLAYSTISHFV